MIKNRAAFAFACLLMPAWAAAQGANLTLPDFSSLAEKASGSVNISISPWLLQTAASLIDGKDPDGAATKELLAAIQSVEVRSFEFRSDAAYSSADIDSVRRQLTGPGWSQLMQVHDRKTREDVDVYVLIDHDRTKGFALIASRPRQFTIINVAGSISLEDLPKLEKRLNLPRVPLGSDGESSAGSLSAGVR
jgi:Domain of unknown function (DUF4252)